MHLLSARAVTLNVAPKINDALFDLFRLWQSNKEVANLRPENRLVIFFIINTPTSTNKTRQFGCISPETLDIYNFPKPTRMRGAAMVIF